MRILFFGTSDFAVPSLQGLAARKTTTVLCVTRPDRPQGRGRKLFPSPVKSAALELGLSVKQPDTLTTHEWSGDFQPDVGVVIAYGRLIPSAILTWPRQGMLGVHPSCLPKYRGASPIAHAILHGETTTGVTIFELNEQIDSGVILRQQTVPIDGQDTTETLSHRLAALGAQLLLEALEGLEQGRLNRLPQQEASASDAPKLTKADGRIKWEASAVAINQLVRAAIPWPGAYTHWRGMSLKVWSTVADMALTARAARPGEVLQADAKGLVVSSGTGTLVIREVQPAGGRRMSAEEFLRGHAMKAGDCLGEGQTTSEHDA